MILFPNCKINIGLNIVSKRPDGYHNLDTVMVPVSWHDVLEIVPAKDSTTTLTVLGRHIECDPEQNLVMRAYKLLADNFDLPPVDIYLEKIIPDGAGLGGGSADASFTLTGLNEMFNLGLSQEELSALAAKLGADCPFFIYNRPMLATGTGTTLSPINIDLSRYTIVIVKPGVKIPTREAYSRVKPAPWDKRLETMLNDLIQNGPSNDFEDSIFPLHNSLNNIKQQLYAHGALYASMSGSGSAIFGIYDNISDAKNSATDLAVHGITHICHII